MSQRDEIAVFLSEFWANYTYSAAAPRAVADAAYDLADALVAKFMFAPSGLTAEKLRAAADIVGRSYDGGLDAAHELREWAAFLDTQETPK